MNDIDDLDTDFDQDDDNDDLDVDETETVARIKRDQLRNLRQQAKEAKRLRQQLSEYQRRDAFAADDLSGLTDKQRDALARLAGDNLTVDTVRQHAIDLGFISEPANDLDDQQDITDATATSQPPATSGGLTAADVAQWSYQERVAFARSNPEQWERMKRGERVTL